MMTGQITLEVVQRALLLSEASGFDTARARAHMSIQPRPTAPPPGVTARQAAVLLLLYPGEGGTLHFPLIRRAETPGVHSGQISLPGGRQEPGETHIDTALREAHEEVGIDPARVQVIGSLASIYVVPSNFMMQPIVGVMRDAPAWRIQDGEVAGVIETPLPLLLDDTLKSERTLHQSGMTLGVRVYTLAGYAVWGATAAALGEFEARLRAAL
jgi:8-oxo-dGTP pyrophosphatase MutT (NUDIX family)